ncbi:MAG: hypothetical protein WAM58_20140 [Candidatus Acidiferrum sp.]
MAKRFIRDPFYQKQNFVRFEEREVLESGKIENEKSRDRTASRRVEENGMREYSPIETNQ